ncbi:MAG: hypothetical protein CMC13_13355 [Flavobacteriaceae bacterium]|nr:hypothetical protein [Flavobacteriaceae bacterium]|tara:strand:+ start:5590 stop:6120 length:531 start_codon:yes stop_codon:yes gene_type:complete
MLNSIKKILLKSNKINFYYKEGFHLPIHFKQRIITFMFQRIFRINSHCKFQVNFTSQVLNPNKIKLGYRVRRSFLLSGNCYIQGNNGIIIGDNTIFASNVKIISANHNIKNLDLHVSTKPVIIGSNCWIGTGAVILPEVEIGCGVIVGANAVVTKSFKESDIIIAGNPAKILKRIK